MKMLIDIDESVYMGITHRQKIRITDMCKACTAIMKGTIIAIEPKESKAKNKDCSTCIKCQKGIDENDS